jgi:hypothetical protein
VQLLGQRRVSTSQNESSGLLIFNGLLQVVFDLAVGGVPFEALLSLLVLEESVPVGLILELFVILG